MGMPLNEILNEKYRILAQKTNLNGLLRAAFSPIQTVEECDSLLEKAQMVRQEIKDIQSELISAFLQDEYTKTFRLRLVRDTQSLTDMPYLRWRNYVIKKDGSKAFYAFFESLSQENERSILVQVEKMRVVINMQAGLISRLVSQLHSVRSSMEQVDKLML